MWQVCIKEPEIYVTFEIRPGTTNKIKKKKNIFQDFIIDSKLYMDTFALKLNFNVRGSGDKIKCICQNF